MDSGLARSLSSGRALRGPVGAPRNDDKSPGSLPAFAIFVALASVRSALRRRGRPRLDQRVVVDGFALRLLVRELALGRVAAVLFRLGEPILGRVLLVELRPRPA